MTLPQEVAHVDMDAATAATTAGERYMHDLVLVVANDTDVIRAHAEDGVTNLLVVLNCGGVQVNPLHSGWLLLRSRCALLALLVALRLLRLPFASVLAFRNLNHLPSRSPGHKRFL